MGRAGVALAPVKDAAVVEDHALSWRQLVPNHTRVEEPVEPGEGAVEAERRVRVRQAKVGVAHLVVEVYLAHLARGGIQPT